MIAPSKFINAPPLVVSQSPYLVPGTQCSSGCHKEPFTPQPWTKDDTCGALFAAGAALTAGAAPGVVTGAAASWSLWGGGVLLTAGQIPCL